MTTRAEAQARIDQIRVFRKELEQLRAQGVVTLTEEQLRAVDAHHAALERDLKSGFDVDPDARSKQLSLGMRIASFLGALSLAASVFFFFYRFWGRLETGVQVAILLSAPLITFAFTVWLRARDPTGYFVKLAAMVSFACFVLDLSMLGQIFNITPSDKALLAWGALGFVLAYDVDSRLLLSAAIICIVCFVAARLDTWSGMYWIYFGERPENFFPAAIALVLVPRIADQRRFDGFAATYRVWGLVTLFGALLVLANWGQASYLPGDPDTIKYNYQAAGFAIAATAIAYGVRQGLPEVVNTSVTFFVILLYTKFYDWWWEVMPKYLFFLVVGLTAVLFLFVLRRLRRVRLGHPTGSA